MYGSNSKCLTRCSLNDIRHIVFDINIRIGLLIYRERFKFNPKQIHFLNLGYLQVKKFIVMEPAIYI